MIDTKEYRLTMEALDKHSTLSSSANSLSKISIHTEDARLRELILAVANIFRKSPSELKSMQKVRLLAAAKTIPLGEKVLELAKYCAQCINSTKPQWQIIAEAHGWVAPSGELVAI